MRSALQKYGFCELHSYFVFVKFEKSAPFSHTCSKSCRLDNFVNVLSSKNGLRSLTRVTTVKFQDALRFEESAPFAYTCHNFD